MELVGDDKGLIERVRLVRKELLGAVHSVEKAFNATADGTWSFLVGKDSMYDDGFLVRSQSMCDLIASIDRLRVSVFEFAWNQQHFRAPYRDKLREWDELLKVSSECL